MSAADSTNARPIATAIPPGDRDLVTRLTVLVLFIFVFTGVFAFLDRVYSQKFFDITGEAKWIWAQHRMSDGTPVAFFAARDFDLPAQRIFTHLKVLGDPEYTVYLNGRVVASRYVGEDRTLDLYDLSDLVRTGRNRIVIAVRAHQGTGGLLAAVDISPEAANWVVTDESWRIYRLWTPDLLAGNPPGGWEVPFVVGEPPDGRWNYLTQRKQELLEGEGEVVSPQRAFELAGLVPTISARGGVAVAGTEKRIATVVTFGRGPVQGRLRVTRERAAAVSRSVPVRFANHPDELGRADRIQRHVVFAPGETAVTMPEAFSFSYAMLFEQGVSAQLVRSAATQ